MKSQAFSLLIFKFLFFLVTFFSPLNLFAYLEAGDILTIGDTRYRINSIVGRGASKPVFHATMLDCTKNCERAIGTPYPPAPSTVDKYKELNLPLNDRLNESSSLNLRKEIPLVRARVNNLPGETYVTVMEYAAGSFDKASTKLLPSSILTLYKDGIKGAEAMQAIGLVNTDIKPENLLVMGPEITDNAIARGHSWGVIGDSDALVQIEKTVSSKIMTPLFSPPEYFRTGIRIDNSSSLWQLAASNYTTLTGELAYSPEELAYFQKMNSPEAVIREGVANAHKRMLKRIADKLDSMIEIQKTKGAFSEVDRLQELKILFANHLQLNSSERLFWPAGVNPQNRAIIAPESRLAIAEHDTVRSFRQIKQDEVSKILGRDGKIKRPAASCSIIDEVVAAEGALGNVSP